MTHRNDLRTEQSERKQEYDDWREAGLGFLCVNNVSIKDSRDPVLCFHRAHPDGPCHVSYASPGGGFCGCNNNIQLPEAEEDELIIRRNLSRSEHYRLDRLLGKDTS